MISATQTKSTGLLPIRFGHRNTNPASVTPPPPPAKRTVNSKGEGDSVVDKQSRAVKTTQSVLFLQRKFNLYSGSSASSSATPIKSEEPKNYSSEKLTRSSIRISKNSLNKSASAASATKNSPVTVQSEAAKGISLKTPAASVKSCTKETNSNDQSDTFIGVQSLKQFWNSRISCSRNKKATQSNSPKVIAKAKIGKKTAQVPGKTTGVHGEIKITKLDPGSSTVTLRQSASFAKADNFNKHKTASSVKQLHHRVSTSDLGRNSSTRGSARQQTKRHTVDSVCIPSTITPTVPSAEATAISISHKNSTSKFPQVATTADGAKIHWPKREDILLLEKNSRRKTLGQSFKSTVTMIKEGEAKEVFNTKQRLPNERKKSNRDKEEKRDIFEATMDTMSESDILKEDIDQWADKNTTAEEMSKAEISKNNSRSATPLSCSTVNSRTDSPRKGALRKASFKTHSGQSQSIRKLVVGSKVAALTHRFNQLVQTDAAIMEEVKRKGLLVHRINGHVYKIKEDPATASVSGEVGQLGRKKSLSRTTSTAESAATKQGLKRRKSSMKKHDPLKKSSSNSLPPETAVNDKKGVKAAIELFEPNSSRTVSTKRNLTKPKVPDKSEHVLRRTKELVSNRREGSSNEVSSKMSVRLDEIKEVIEEKPSPVIQETNSPVSINAHHEIRSEADGPATLKKDKSVYGRIYEKLKINKSSFLHAKKAPHLSPATLTLQISNPVLNSSTYDLSEPIVLGSESSGKISPEQKIFEALQSVDRKIESLCRSSTSLRCAKEDEDQMPSHNLQPNQSFLFRSTSTKSPLGTNNGHQNSFDLASPKIEPCAALNVSLIKSKTMSMDERNFPFICRALDIEMDNISRSVSTNNLPTVSSINSHPNVEARTEYQDIINETDKLIRRMNEAYGEENEYSSRSPADKLFDSPQASLENNYDLYEQIASELEERGRKVSEGEESTTAADNEEESIYQTVIEVKSAIRHAFIADETKANNSYDSCAKYEAIDELRRNYRQEQTLANGSSGHSTEDGGYEICSPPEPPPPRKNSTPICTSEPPQLPVPKRNKPTDIPLSSKSTFYAPAPDQLDKGAELLTKSNIQTDNRTDIFHSDHVYEENIYDTIRSSDNTSLLSNNYESIALIRGTVNSLDDGKSKIGSDTISFTSNCYESLRGSTLTINHLSNPGNKFDKSDYYLAEHGLRYSESVSTLSSDHKTNSIYDTTMHYGSSIATTPGDRHSIAGTSMILHNGSALGSIAKTKHSPSESYSENSDEWVDISDGEEKDTGVAEDEAAGGTKQKFIIVRERLKNHRCTTGDWNAKIREQRTHQIQQSQYYDDDSDHHYESMYAGNYENQLVHKLHEGPGPAPQNLDIIPFDDQEFDSFDSDLDEVEDVKKNDSGVDVSNTRLPDPPSSSNQVYALMQKFKTLGSLSEISKSLSRFATKKRAKRGERPGEISSNVYEHGSKKKAEGQSNSQFYANMDIHGSSVAAINQSLPSPTLGSSTPTHIESPLPSPLMPVASATASPSFTEYTAVMPVSLTRKKSKGGKSFKSKLRRSLVPDTNNFSAISANSTNSTFYVNGDSPDMDSGVFTGSEKTLKIEEGCKESNSFTDLVNEIKTRNANSAHTSSTEDERRRSFATNRPLSPPPAPPVMPKNGSDNANDTQRRQSKTSWYDECGVFKPDPVKELEKKAASMTNWYADSGLYQTSGDSVISSSGSSGVSTGGECNGQDDNSHSMFCNEPLYQIYSAAKLESITRDIEMESDGYEEIGKRIPDPEELQKKPLRPTALQLVTPQKGPSRTLWSEIPEVINSEILSTLTPTEKRIQEAKFEIITSEASYLKSLNLLKSHFMNHPAFRDVNILSAADRKTLFSYTIPVLNCSEKLLTDLENCWQDNIMLIGLSHSILKHAESSFKVYVSYCEHQVRLDRILKKLKDSNKKFCETLEQVELNTICCGLSFHSFLMLPMQRITRLPLLIDAVLSKLTADDDEYENWRVTLATLNRIVSQCNEAAHKCEQVYEMQYISRQIEFPSEISPLPIVPMGIPAPNSRRRALVRRGELVHLVWRGDDGKLTFGRKFTKSAVYVFLFTDLLVLTKRKSDDTYLVFDHCCRSMLTVSSGDVIPQLPTKEVAMAGKHLILMTLLENHQGKTVELILACESETDRTRWLKATEPPLSENPDETLYEQWDCPQVTVLHAYQAKQPDELSLDSGDVVNVTRKMADGWYHGERIRDGEQGWFPGNYTEEVASPHVRARNLKQRYRLLTYTANYLESQKKTK